MTYDLPVFTQKPLIAIVIKQEPEKEQPKQYTVQDGDTITSVALAQGTSVERIWRANSQISHPDVINVGESLKIPLNDEVLPERPLPVIVQPTAPTPASKPSGFSTSGNSYSPGYCTWYVKNMRPELPNNLGNADAWAYNAVRYGLTVSNSPTVGAVAVAINYGHVSIVTAVHGSTVTVSEMNFVKWNVISTRIAPISEFNYIY